MHAGWRFDEVLTVAVPQHASCVWEVFAIRLVRNQLHAACCQQTCMPLTPH